VSNYFIHELFICEAREGGLIWHYRVVKTLDILREYFYWPQMKRYVQRIYDRCITCRQAKSKFSHHGLYTLLPKEP
jgi:hypothetical protein